MATWSPRPAAMCRSRQETLAFSSPSSNHLIETSPVKSVFLIFVGAFIQAIRDISLRQNPFGSLAASATMAARTSAVIRAVPALRGRDFSAGTRPCRVGLRQSWGGSDKKKPLRKVPEGR
jgi:hypothetical protein